MKKSLSDNIIEGIAYKQVRDAFKQIGFDSFNLQNFTTNLFLKDIKSAYKNEGDYVPPKQFIHYSIQRQLLGIERPHDVDLNSFICKAKNTLEHLLKEGLAEANDNDNDFFQITPDGHPLRM